MKIISQNKKAHHDYFIVDTFESGIKLTGTEIKSIRLGKTNINDAYIKIKNQEAFIVNMHIAKYDKGNIFNHDETRDRKLLLHKKEIIKLETKSKLESMTLIPLKVYLNEGLCKIEIALAKGKNKGDKREDLKEHDDLMHMKKVMKDINRYQ